MPLDIGMTPPPPANVSAQMRPVPGTPGGLGPMYGNQQMGQTMQSTMEASAKIQQVGPILLEISRMVPALAPDAAGLATRLQSRLQGPVAPPNQPPSGALSPQVGHGAEGIPPPAAPPPGIPSSLQQPPGLGIGPASAAAPGGPAPPNGGIPTAMSAVQLPSVGIGATPGGGFSMAPSGPMPVSPNVTTGGLMGLVQQAEMILPQISGADPSVANDVTFFIARMREEVPKVIRGLSPSMTPAPTDEMVKALPISV